jgi:hypothetical protein
MPQRIQRKRSKGWRMPEGAVYVGRPSKWGNPWRAGWGITETAEEAVTAFRAAIDAGGFDDLSELRGKDLACWCRLDQPCHADVLLELANTPT